MAPFSRYIENMALSLFVAKFSTDTESMCCDVVTCTIAGLMGGKGCNILQRGTMTTRSTVLSTLINLNIVAIPYTLL
jgi:hypothetical protein